MRIEVKKVSEELELPCILRNKISGNLYLYFKRNPYGDGYWACRVSGATSRFEKGIVYHLNLDDTETAPKGTKIIFTQD